MKRFAVLTAVLLCLALAGCCGGENADLVVVNESGRAVYSITVEYANSSETVLAANGSALMESGQSYGLELEEETATVTLLDRAQRPISQNRVARQEGRRLFLTIDGVTEGSLRVKDLR